MATSRSVFQLDEAVRSVAFEYVGNSGLEHALLKRVKMHTSHFNGCTYCLDMQGKGTHASGETGQRLYVFGAWREAPFNGWNRLAIRFCSTPGVHQPAALKHA